MSPLSRCPALDRADTGAGTPLPLSAPAQNAPSEPGSETCSDSNEPLSEVSVAATSAPLPADAAPGPGQPQESTDSALSAQDGGLPLAGRSGAHGVAALRRAAPTHADSPPPGPATSDLYGAALPGLSGAVAPGLAGAAPLHSGSSAAPICLPALEGDLLGCLMPMFLWVGADGIIRGIGPTLAKIVGPQDVRGTLFSDHFILRRARARGDSPAAVPAFGADMASVAGGAVGATAGGATTENATAGSASIGGAFAGGATLASAAVGGAIAGGAIASGPTAGSATAGGAIAGSTVTDPTAPAAGLAASGGLVRLHLDLVAHPEIALRGTSIAIGAEGSAGALVNLTFGIHLGEAVREFKLTETDFSASDLAIELLYLGEANAAVLGELSELTARLELARRSAVVQSLTDPLTGLANRRAFDAAFEAELRAQSQGGAAFALAHVDLDRFKGVNDTFGHAAGDQVLTAVGRRLISELRQGDLVARTGGDEFLLMLRGASDPEPLLRLGQRLIAKLEEPVICGDVRAEVSASVGIALSTDFQSAPAADLLGAADTALYAAKRAGRGCCRIYDAGMMQPL